MASLATFTIVPVLVQRRIEPLQFLLITHNRNHQHASLHDMPNHFHACTCTALTDSRTFDHDWSVCAGLSGRLSIHIYFPQELEQLLSTCLPADESDPRVQLPDKLNWDVVSNVERLTSLEVSCIVGTTAVPIELATKLTRAHDMKERVVENAICTLLILHDQNWSYVVHLHSTALRLSSVILSLVEELIMLIIMNHFFSVLYVYVSDGFSLHKRLLKQNITAWSSPCLSPLLPRGPPTAIAPSPPLLHPQCQRKFPKT